MLVRLGVALLLIAWCVGLSEPALAQSLQHEVRVRLGLVGVEGTGRDGSEISRQSGESRIQAGLAWVPTQEWRLQARLAARFSTEEDLWPWHVRGPAFQPGSGGLQPNDIGLDQLFATWQPSEAVVLRAGRMQTRFVLPDVTSRSLHRNDAPGFGVLWIDGAHLRADVPGVGRTHVVAMHTGPTVATSFRSPLRFGDGLAGRVGVFAALEGREAIGPLVHRALHATVLPNALPTLEGEGSAYVAVSAQGATAFPLEAGRFVVAAEAGWVPTPPERTEVNLPGDGRAGGTAGQLTLSLMGFGGGAHDLGLFLSRLDAGWLLASNISPNMRETEVRYHWRFAPRQRLDFRVRHRQDIVVPRGAVQGLAEWGAFVRYNVQF